MMLHVMNILPGSSAVDIVTCKRRSEMRKDIVLLKSGFICGVPIVSEQILMMYWVDMQDSKEKERSLINLVQCRTYRKGPIAILLMTTSLLDFNINKFMILTLKKKSLDNFFFCLTTCPDQLTRTSPKERINTASHRHDPCLNPSVHLESIGPWVSYPGWVTFNYTILNMDALNYF